MDRTVEYLAGCAHEIASWWDELHADRERGTPRRWAQQATRAGWSPTHGCGMPWAWAADSTPEAPRPYCPRCTATGPVAVAWLRPPATRSTLAGSPAPARLDVLDTIPLIGRTVLTLEDTTRQVLGDGPAVRAGYRTDAEGRLWTTPALWAAVWPDKPDPQVPLGARYLARQAHRIAAHAELVDVAIEELRYARGRLRQTLGTAEQVRALGAPCPICDTLSLRVYLAREVVACTSWECWCQTGDCPCHRGGRHLWRYDPNPARDEWRWLAQLLDEDLAAWLASDDTAA
ncbi:hypothetical protein FrEUN1fDRAFT_7647 [Parafrankia sp. EUN1f]|nr:hypothetical protein FrEUN1fDRAFT_7647 [Parafrankia sp. EUN1f]